MAQYTLFFPTVVKNEGYYSNVKGDTVRLQNVGQDFHEGDVVQIVNDKIIL